MGTNQSIFDFDLTCKDPPFRCWIPSNGLKQKRPAAVREMALSYLSRSVKLALILLQQKTVKLAAIFLQQKTVKLAAAVKNGKVSSNFSAAKNGQVSSNFDAAKMVKLAAI